jgi:plasmid maintenance system antidote protein VapI
MNQLALPIEIRPAEVARKHTLGDAIQMCAELAGFSLDKELQQVLGVDKAQFSRWMSGQEGISWPKFSKLMDACGNDAPLFWMLHQRGYDLTSLRKTETDTETQLRLAREEIVALRRVMMAGAK